MNEAVVLKIDRLAL